MADRIVTHDEISWIEPDWPAPANVRAISSLRRGGFSESPWATLNLGDHVGDQPDRVARNRHLLMNATGAPSGPNWLTQVHGCHVVRSEDAADGCEADAVFALNRGELCAVMTADCLPVLICDHSGRHVAAAHAGWRGLCNGVLEATIDRLDVPAGDLIAWLGPAISQAAFEVGDEVRTAFISKHPPAHEAFVLNAAQRWMADIYLLARQRLEQMGVTGIYGGEHCTYSESEAFFSYRRDGVTGRMATMIWIEA